VSSLNRERDIELRCSDSSPSILKPRVRRTVKYCRRLRRVRSCPSGSLPSFSKPSVDIPDLRGCGLFRPVFERPIKSRLVGAINADSARESDSPLPDSLSSLLFARPTIRCRSRWLVEISVRDFSSQKLAVSAIDAGCM